MEKVWNEKMASLVEGMLELTPIPSFPHPNCTDGGR